MNFNEICQLAESTRDEVYGLRVGSDRFGHHPTKKVSVRSVKILPCIVLRLKRTESSAMMMP
jgi:hypothetical protein